MSREDGQPPGPRVSVIIPTYNRAHIVGEAIESVLAQSYRHLEVIVVDDASTDGTARALSRYVAEHGDKIRVIHRESNGGVSAARNDGIRASTGQYIAFLDSDDLYLPERIATAVAFLDEHEQYGAVYTGMVHVDSERGTSGRWLSASGGGRSGWILTDVLRGPLVPTPTVTVRRQVLARTGLFDETLCSGEDTDLWIRLAREVPFGYIDEAYACFRVSPLGLSRLGIRMAESRARGSLKARRMLTGLTPHQHRLLCLRLYWDLRNYASCLAQEGECRHARLVELTAARAALSGGMPVAALKALAAALVGDRLRRRLGRLRAAVGHLWDSSSGRL